MSQVRKSLFQRKPQVVFEPVQTLESASPVRTNLLTNLRFTWKLVLIVLALVLSTAIVTFTSLGGLGTLRTALSNSYEFALTPTKALASSQLAYADAQRFLELLNRNTLNAETRQQYAYDAQGALELGEANFNLYTSQYALSIRPDSASNLGSAGATIISSEKAAVARIQELVDQNKIEIADYFEIATVQTPTAAIAARAIVALDSLRGSIQTLSDVNDNIASTQREIAFQNAEQTQRLIFIALGVGLFVGIVLAFLVARSTAVRMANLERGAQGLRSGNLDIRIPVSGRDEIGSVANTLNASILQLKDLLSEQDLERQRGLKLQENVSEFLNVAMDIAGGDLTKKGTVTDDVLGNVVDAINIMTDEFGVLLGNVRSAAERVSSSANSMTQTSQGILENAQSQATLAQGAQNQTNLVAEAMQSLAMTADKGATAAQFTLEASSAGTVAVTQTREQLVQIRDQMISMTQGMQGLARRSDEINEVVRTISRFASQTNLLALGASLEAAGAGSAGARFGAVANAVRSLADDSAKAASRITNIIKDVQNEIQTLSARAVSGAEQVQLGTQVAAQASERLERISDLAKQSAQVSLDIASLATEQAESVETVRENVTRIVKTAQVTESNTRQGGVAAGELQTLSQSLSQSLERFRLPA
jgi:twitching motility protein PilJ